MQESGRHANGQGAREDRGKASRRSYGERARRELVCRDREGKDAVAQGDRSWFRPGQLVVDRTTAETYLRSYERTAKDEGFPSRGDVRVDLIQVFLDPGTDVFDLTAWIQRDAVRRGDRRVVVGPNYCWRGEPMYHGGPGGAPRRAEARQLANGATAGDHPADIATLDTGYLDDLPVALAACLKPDQDDQERLDDDANGVLDTQNGHGSFVAGIVHQVAPGLVIDPGKVLDSTGVGDDASVARELLENVSPVVNLSLGGYTEDDRAPTALSEIVRILGRSTVLVAAAGNNSSDRPFWPAAFKGVLAVAAYDSTRRGPVSTSFSNHGPWVDVCAPGRGIVSTFATFPQDAPEGQRLFDGWAEWDGTSFAAPQVAAVIAARVRDTREKQEPFSPLSAVAWFLEQCRYEPVLADYGLVWAPSEALVGRGRREA